jgi:hypothetical protein
MPPRVHTCPVCGHRWPQRHARFCGRCGAALRATSTTRRGSRGTGVAWGTLLGVGVLALVGSLTRIEFSQPPHDDVDLDEDIDTADPRLSAEELQALRDQVAADRLRCEPRGCEVWRIDARIAGGRSVAGAVGVDDELIALLEDGAEGRGDDDPEPARVVGLDPRSGELRWEHLVTDAPATDDASGTHGGDQLLVAGRDGLLVVHGARVTALDADGEVVWEQDAPAPSGGHWRIDTAVLAGDVVLVAGGTGAAADTGGIDRARFAGALDSASGQPRWTEAVHEVAYLDDEVVVVLDAARRPRALEPATGEVRWEATRALADPEGWRYRTGPWLVVQTDTDVHDLIEVATGRHVGTLHGTLVGGPVERDGWLVAILARGDPGSGDLAHDADLLRVLTVGPDASEAWSVNIGEIRPWWTCCEVAVEEDHVTVASARYERTFALDTGALEDVELVHDRAPQLVAGTTQPAPGVTVRYHHDGHGMDVRSADGQVSVRGRPASVDVLSWDPLVVSDGDVMLGIGPPDR